MRYVVEGIKESFRVGLDYSSRKCRWAGKNMGSAIEYPEVMREYLAKEYAEGRVLGPLPMHAISGVQVSRFGVIPKGKTGKWRLIVDLSSPDGASVNNGINLNLCSLMYVSVDDAVRAVVRAGRGAFLAKADIKQAYRMVPVHPSDRLLLGMVWENSLFVDSALPFGLCSAPKIFNALAVALEWMIRQEGVESVLHYLDNFFYCSQERDSMSGSATEPATCVCMTECSHSTGETGRSFYSLDLFGHQNGHSHHDLVAVGGEVDVVKGVSC